MDYPRVHGGNRQLAAAPPRMRRDYPRVHGETRGDRLADQARRRTIPACTGKPRARWPRRPPIRDYPRVHGETMSGLPNAIVSPGLSPRARGNPSNGEIGRPPSRTIPACTGKPQGGTAAAGDERDYPRVHGETTRLRRTASKKSGLSPRARGNLPAPGLDCRTERTIPACTGKPGAWASPAPAWRDYPRVHGETDPNAVFTGSIHGLSPRARGNPGRVRREAVAERTIPACTGKPPAKCPCSTDPRDYPRVHGETSPTILRNPCATGLSPRARGNRKEGRPRQAMSGTIPACTGKPPPRWWTSSARRDYPRVHGETARSTGESWKDEGLSPRARGNPRHQAPRAGVQRTIPACTGKPLNC